MSDAFDSRPVLAKRQPSRRDVLWAELERLQEQLGLPYPTETLTLEALEERIAERKREASEE